MVQEEHLYITQDGTIYRLDQPFIVRVGRVSQPRLRVDQPMSVLEIGGYRYDLDESREMIREKAAELVTLADQDHPRAYHGSPIQ